MRRISDDFITSTEAARILGINPKALQKLIQKGRLPAEKIANRWLIRRDILEEFAKTYEGKVGRPRTKRKYTRGVKP